MKLSADLIYEAALDDALFAQFPSIIAAALDARSCVLHWRDSDGVAAVAAHSGHFSDAHMLDYTSNFVGHDLWTDAGMRHGMVNKAWNVSNFVPSSDYEGSIFFNEWIRAIGDDTFYCCGSVMRTSEGDGIIGLHRGRSQGDFSAAALAELNSQVDHLRRMFTIRGRLSRLTRRNDLLAAIFDSPHQAAFLCGADGRLVVANPLADAMLRDIAFVRTRGGQLTPANARLADSFDAAMADAGSADAPRATSCLLTSAAGTIMVASLTPLTARQSPGAVLVTMDSPQPPPSTERLASHLRAAFGLSAAEADVALRLAEGGCVQAIADHRRSSAATVRTQVKTVLSKLHARRQGDVVRIVGRLSSGMPVEIPTA